MITFTQLREGSLKTAVFSFGRFNPPTIGHELLINKVSKVASRNRADAFIFPSGSQDAKKNPLDYDEKIKYMKKMFKPRGQDIFKYSSQKPATAMHVLSLLHDEGYEHVIMVVGSDRVGQFKKLLPQYNGVDGKAHGFYDFKKIDIESAGERDPDADDATGMSASKLRALAVDSDFDGFKNGLPDTLSDRDKRSLYQAIRKGMKLAVMEAQMENKLSKPIPKMKNSVKNPKKAMNKFVSSTAPKDSGADKVSDVDDILAKAEAGKKPPSPTAKESICMEKFEYKGRVYHVDTDTKNMFEYLLHHADTKSKKEYFKRALEESEEFWDKFIPLFGTQRRVPMWEINRIKEHTKKTAEYITMISEDADYSFMNVHLDRIPVNEVPIDKPVSDKLSQILEFNKNRAKEGKALEYGTDKYTQYTVDLTPNEKLKPKKTKQTETINNLVSRIIANRSK